MASNTCLIGYGYWGKNLLRNLVQLKTIGELSVLESNPAKQAEASRIYPGIKIERDFTAVLNNPCINAVIIATPTSTHFEMAKQCLVHGKNCLVEKPLTLSLHQAKELCGLANEKRLILMVDHVYLYNPAVQLLKQYFTTSALGKINYIDATRVNLGIYQNDTNVLWDLACHDIAIVNFLLEERPTHVRTIARKNKLHNTEDVAYLFLKYSSGLLVQINASWASPVKVRRMVIGGEDRMIVYDDVEPTNKLVVYDYGSNPNMDHQKTQLTDYRLGNIVIPKYEIKEALTNVIEDFYSCINSGENPVSDGVNALLVTKILEKAQESLFSDGNLIAIN